MLVKYLVAVLLLAAQGLSINIKFLGKSNPSIANSKWGEDGFELVPMDLLDPLSRKPEIFTTALRELSSLKSEPVCTRLAAQVHIQACQRLNEDLAGMEHLLTEEHEMEHQIKSFAASLTICAMEAGGVDLSGPCSPFTSSSLRSAYFEGIRNLKVSPEQLNTCIHGLRKNDKEAPFIIYNDMYKSAAMFCRASRIDIEKDETILLYRNLTKILEDLKNSLFDDVEQHKNSAGESFRQTKREMQDQADQAVKLHDEFDSISSDIYGLRGNIQELMQVIQTGTVNIEQTIKNIFKITTRSISDLLVHQETAVEVYTSNSISNMDRLIEVFSTHLYNVNQTLGTMVATISDRQESLEKIGEKIQLLDVLFDNMTESFAAQNQLIRRNNEGLMMTGELLKDINSNVMMGSWALCFWVVLGLLAAWAFRGGRGLVQAFCLCIAAGIISMVISYGVEMLQRVMSAFVLTNLIPDMF